MTRTVLSNLTQTDKSSNTLKEFFCLSIVVILTKIKNKNTKKYAQLSNKQQEKVSR